MRAFLFDLNGTMINDMDYHARAWMNLVNDRLDGSFTIEEVAPQLYGKNPEILVRLFGADKFTAEEMEQLSMEKEVEYQQEYLPHLALLPGLHDFLEKAYQVGIPMAIGSAAIRFNIDFVLNNLNIGHYFKTVVAAEDVLISKPHPETYLKIAERLQIDPTDCIVFEDVPKGVEAAANAGMKAVVRTTTHTQADFAKYDNILHFSEDFNDEFYRKLIS